MRIAAETLAPQAIAGASRRCAASGSAFAGDKSATWSTTGLPGSAATKPRFSMVMTPVPTHLANTTARRLSEVSP